MASAILVFVDSGGKITLVLNTDDSMTPSFTQSAHIIDVTQLSTTPDVGWTYDGTNFIAHEVPTSDNPPVAPNPNPAQ
jgi:hypothetical protein